MSLSRLNRPSPSRPSSFYMRPLSAAELLDTWERGLSGPAFTRALLLLAAASPDVSQDVVATLSVGERDRQLLTLREWTFGSQLPSVANCPACGERLEWIFNVADLRVSEAPQLSGDLSLELDSYCVSFRLPNTLDLAAVADSHDAASAGELLLEKCVLETQCDGQTISIKEMPAAVTDAVVKRMAEADPQADLRLDLSCPTCGHRWQAWFDIESFFWNEINSWAQRVLTEVHTLASNYGWRERDILDLSPRRRQFYLGLISG